MRRPFSRVGSYFRKRKKIMASSSQFSGGSNSNNFGYATVNNWQNQTLAGTAFTNAPTNFIVFYGFEGKLAMRFSVFQDQLPNELVDVFSNQKIYLQSFYSQDFFDAIGKFHTSSLFREISIEEAIETMKVKEKPVVDLSFLVDEPEVDEFDEKCTEECIPGNHKCGK